MLAGTARAEGVKFELGGYGASREAVRKMSASDRRALIAFLESL